MRTKSNHIFLAQQSRNTLQLPIAIFFLVCILLFGFGVYYFLNQFYMNQSQNFDGQKQIELEPVTHSTPSGRVVSPIPSMNADWKMYVDAKNRYSFKYRSDLVFTPSSSTDNIFYLETQNYKAFTDGSYRVQITITPNDQGIPEVLPPIDENTPEGTFVENRDFINYNGVVGVVASYTGSWKHYKRYDMYFDNWNVHFSGMGSEHSILDQMVATINVE